MIEFAVILFYLRFLKRIVRSFSSEENKTCDKILLTYFTYFKIYFRSKKKGSRKKFLWASHLWVDRR